MVPVPHQARQMIRYGSNEFLPFGQNAVSLLKLTGALVDQLFQMMAITIEFLTDPFAFGDIFLDHEIMSNLAIGLAHWRDIGKLDVGLAILTPVDEFALPSFFLLEGFPKAGIRCLRVVSVQDTESLADHLIAVIAATLAKGFVDIFDMGIEVSNNDTARTLFHRHGQLVQLIFCPLAFGDVEHRTDKPTNITLDIGKGGLVENHIVNCATGIFNL